MKKIIVIILLGTLAFPSFCQLSETESIFYDHELDIYHERIQRARDIFAFGMVTAFIGAGSLATPAVKGNDAARLTGMALTGAGGLMILTAIPYGVHSNIKMQQYEEKLKLGFFYSREMKGIGLTVCF